MPRILIIDDHPILREGLKSCIAQQMRGWVCSEAQSAGEALHLLGTQRVSLIILDLTIRGRGGLELLADLHRAYPRTPTLAFGMVSEDQFAARALKAGAAGFLGGRTDATELKTALERISAGGKYISPSLAEGIALGKLTPIRDCQLSNREYEMLRAIARGKTLTRISQELAISVKTVSAHKRRIMHKLGVTNNAELIRRAIDDEIVAADDNHSQPVTYPDTPPAAL